MKYGCYSAGPYTAPAFAPFVDYCTAGCYLRPRALFSARLRTRFRSQLDLARGSSYFSKWHEYTGFREMTLKQLLHPGSQLNQVLRPPSSHGQRAFRVYLLTNPGNGLKFSPYAETIAFWYKGESSRRTRPQSSTKSSDGTA